MNYWFINNRKHFLGLIFGGGQKTRAIACCSNYGFSNFHYRFQGYPAHSYAVAGGEELNLIYHPPSRETANFSLLKDVMLFKILAYLPPHLKLSVGVYHPHQKYLVVGVNYGVCSWIIFDV